MEFYGVIELKKLQFCKENEMITYQLDECYEFITSAMLNLTKFYNKDYVVIKNYIIFLKKVI